MSYTVIRKYAWPTVALVLEGTDVYLVEYFGAKVKGTLPRH